MTNWTKPEAYSSYRPKLRLPALTDALAVIAKRLELERSRAESSNGLR